MPASSEAQQKAAAIALKAKETGDTKGLKGPAKTMLRMSKAELKKFASTKHKGLPKHVKKKKKINEGAVENEPMQNLQFWVVIKPHSYESNINDICTEVTPFQFNEMCMEGLTPDQVHGFYIDQPEAQNTAKQLLTDLQDKAIALEELKTKVTDALQKKIDELQKLAETHMKSMKDNPDAAEAHQMKAESYLSKIRELRSKHKMVEGAKKDVAKQDYDGDGEVETPEEEYKGSVDKAIKRAKNKK